MSKIKVIFLLLITFLGLIILDFFGVIWHNAIFAHFYKTKGLDVSQYQGIIDWKKVANTNKYSFVYIKATEGHDFEDDNFESNWQGTKENNLHHGAYHFFSTRSSGLEQAKYFISKVPKEDNALPAVIDIEISLDKNKTTVKNELTNLAKELENYYSKKPILYVTYQTYNTYIKGNFNDYKIWIRDIFKPPFIQDRKWTIWQYNNRGRVDGIDNYVDINVSKESF